ncbi:SDR family oxidoreductase [Pseudonocardia sp. MH-G8]|uniref:SDR family oxidoreductase n=1 Tax=Pseudonocardia sp. MH-G8 TaxID=1854588 RepID=UPI000BA02203|nr:SDR family oxidoreductase [Pseudonocardia sp. MH-G8]OZM80773.1 short-chain dehydrogenase [Pseudonocardia sp. MH-G8]
MKIENSVALVTGANRGIGEQFARSLRERGASKVYGGARDAASVTVPGVEPVQLDITDPESVTAAAALAGDVTLLVNNAGVAHAQDLVDGDVDRIRAEIETNVFGTLSMVRAFAPILARNGGGAIVNVLSAASWFCYPGSSSYAVSKAAQWNLTNGVRMELDAQGTLVVGVHVGMVDTDLTAGLDVEKMPPAEFVEIALDGLENGQVEIVADDLSLRAKAALAGAPRLLVP